MMTRGLCRLAAVLAGVLVAVALTSAPARAVFGTGMGLWGISCDSAMLCVAVDETSHAAISTNPTALRPTWRLSALELVDPTAVACVTRSLCVVGDSNGRAALSSDPGSATPAWRTSRIFDHQFVTDISCPSTSLCAAAGNGGVAISTDPTSAAPAWRVATPDPARIADVSCPSSSLCVAVDSQGSTMITTEPTAVRPTWSGPIAIDSSPLVHVSCPSTDFCAAIDRRGAVTASRDPGATPPAWSTPRPVVTVGTNRPSISCGSATACVAVEQAGGDLAAAWSSDAASTWTPLPRLGGSLAGPSPLVSCGGPSLCAVAGGYRIALSTEPTSPGGWSRPLVEAHPPFGALGLSGGPSMRGRALTLRLGCTGAWFQHCPGGITLTVRERLSGRGDRITGVVAGSSARRIREALVGQASFDLESGYVPTHHVALQLNALGRSLLRRFGRLPATLTLRGDDPALLTPLTPVVVASRKVLFRAH
jgi:hypothetical protein